MKSQASESGGTGRRAGLRLLAAEREEIEASAAWDSGRADFEASSAELQKLTAKLYAAGVAEGETLCGHLGGQALDAYTGVPDQFSNPAWHRFWLHKLAVMGRQG